MYYTSKRFDNSQDKSRPNSTSKVDSMRKGISLTHRSRDNSHEKVRISTSGHEDDASPLGMTRSGSTGNVSSKNRNNERIKTAGDKVRYQIKMITNGVQTKQKEIVFLQSKETKIPTFPSELAFYNSKLVTSSTQLKTSLIQKNGAGQMVSSNSSKNLSYLQTSKTKRRDPPKNLKEFTNILGQLKQRRDPSPKIVTSSSTTKLNTSSDIRYKSTEKTRMSTNEKLTPKPKKKVIEKEKDDYVNNSIIINDVEQQYYFENFAVYKFEGEKSVQQSIIEPQKPIPKTNKPSPLRRPTTPMRETQRIPTPIKEMLRVPTPIRDMRESTKALPKKTPPRDFKEILQQRQTFQNIVATHHKETIYSVLKKKVPSPKKPTTQQPQAIVSQKPPQFITKIKPEQTPIRDKSPMKPQYPQPRASSTKRTVKTENSFVGRDERIDFTSFMKSIRLSEMFTGKTEEYNVRKKHEEQMKWLEVSVLETEEDMFGYNEGVRFMTEYDDTLDDYEYIKPKLVSKKKT